LLRTRSCSRLIKRGNIALESHTSTIVEATRKIDNADLAPVRAALLSMAFPVDGILYDHSTSPVCDLARHVAEYYATQCPALYGAQKAVTSKARTITGTPFTTAVINKNKDLPYHKDSRNYPNLMSCVVVLRNNTRGGYLSMPELDTRFDAHDGALLIFDGQNTLHGVTQIVQLFSYSYRFSLLFYAFKS